MSCTKVKAPTFGRVDACWSMTWSTTGSPIICSRSKSWSSQLMLPVIEQIMARLRWSRLRATTERQHQVERVLEIGGAIVTLTFNLADLTEAAVDRVPERLALITSERTLTYAGLEERANRLAAWLASQGIGPGDHIGCYLFNGTEYVETMLAAYKLRAVPINVNYRYVEDELRYLFR